MCRFVAYLGKQAIPLAELLSEEKNSLIEQSKHAKKTSGSGLNADGFGVAWYVHDIDAKPALFKSINPAWSDQNLHHISAKSRSRCFLGHIRAATVGTVSLENCHPFSFGNCSFVHNGTIKHFEVIRRDILTLLSDDIFENVKGNTDSEHFFALVMHLKKDLSLSLDQAVVKAIETITNLQKNHNHACLSRINTALTDGNSLVVTRYISDTEETPISLYYKSSASHVIVASEPLDSIDENWTEVPLNTLMVISPDLSIQFKQIAINC